jgi:hypothetical protein
MSNIKFLFCWLYAQWLSKAVDSKSDPLVVVLDNLFGSGCKYCMAVRALLFGFGAATGFFAPWLWLMICGHTMAVSIVLMTIGERLWLCETK